MDSEELDYVGVFDEGKELAFLAKLICYISWLEHHYETLVNAGDDCGYAWLHRVESMIRTSSKNA